MSMVVDLPAPFGPEQRDGLARGDVDVDAAHGVHRALSALLNDFVSPDSADARRPAASAMLIVTVTDRAPSRMGGPVQ